MFLPSSLEKLVSGFAYTVSTAPFTFEYPLGTLSMCDVGSFNIYASGSEEKRRNWMSFVTGDYQTAFAVYTDDEEDVGEYSIEIKFTFLDGTEFYDSIFVVIDPVPGDLNPPVFIGRIYS